MGIRQPGVNPKNSTRSTTMLVLRGSSRQSIRSASINRVSSDEEVYLEKIDREIEREQRKKLSQKQTPSKHSQIVTKKGERFVKVKVTTLGKILLLLLVLSISFVSLSVYTFYANGSNSKKKIKNNKYSWSGMMLEQVGLGFEEEDFADFGKDEKFYGDFDQDVTEDDGADYQYVNFGEGTETLFQKKSVDVDEKKKDLFKKNAKRVDSGLMAVDAEGRSEH